MHHRSLTILDLQNASAESIESREIGILVLELELLNRRDLSPHAIGQNKGIVLSRHFDEDLTPKHSPYRLALIQVIKVNRRVPAVFYFCAFIAGVSSLLILNLS